MAETRTVSSTGGAKGMKTARFDLIPPGALRALAEHFGRGARKYDDNQWRKGYEWSKSYAALQRHLADFWAGKDYDVCSNDPGGCSKVDAEGRPYEALEPGTCFNHTGSHHLDAAMWHSFVLRTFVDEHPNHDDRYRRRIESPDTFFITEQDDEDIAAVVAAQVGESPVHLNRPSVGTFHLPEEMEEEAAEEIWAAHVRERRKLDAVGDDR